MSAPSASSPSSPARATSSAAASAPSAASASSRCSPVAPGRFYASPPSSTLPTRGCLPQRSPLVSASGAAASSRLSRPAPFPSAAASASAAGCEGDALFSFGKHAGKTFSAVAREDSSYCSWALSTPNPSGSLLQFVEFLKRLREPAARPPRDDDARGNAPAPSRLLVVAEASTGARAAHAAVHSLSRGRASPADACPVGTSSAASAPLAPPRPRQQRFARLASGAAAPTLAPPAQSRRAASDGVARALGSPGAAAAPASFPKPSRGGGRPPELPPPAAGDWQTAAPPSNDRAAAGSRAPSAAADIDDWDELLGLAPTPAPAPTVSLSAFSPLPPVASSSAPSASSSLSSAAAGSASSAVCALRGAGASPPQPASAAALALSPIDLDVFDAFAYRQPSSPPASSLRASPTTPHRPQPRSGSPVSPRTAARPSAAPESPPSAPRVSLDVCVAFQLCAPNAFRLVAQKNAAPGRGGGGGRGKAAGGTSSKAGGGWSAHLPRELWLFLKELGPLSPLERGADAHALAFAAEKYDLVLRSLKERFSFPDLFPLPPFVLRAFRAFMSFASPQRLPRKTALILLNQTSPCTKQRLGAAAAPPEAPAETGESRAAAEGARDAETALVRELKPFQLEGYRFGLQRNGRVLIGDEMGLGKTLQALAIAAFYSREWPFLVICPSSIRFQWRDQALRWLPELLGHDEICVVKSGRAEIPVQTKMVIISYDLITKQKKFMAPYQIVICDESHYLKNHNAKRTQTICPLLRSAKRAILLSGTPALNRPVELFQQLDALLPELCTYREFAERYSVQVWNPFTRHFEYEGHQHPEELHLLLKHTVMIRRLKEQVHSELPRKIRSRVPIEIPARELKEIREKMAELEAEQKASLDAESRRGQDAENYLEQNKASSSPLVTELFTLTGVAKRAGVCEFLSYLFRGSTSDLKVIVFAHHRAVLDYIEEYLLKNEKKRLVRIDGRTPQDKRELLVKEFQTSPACQVALLSITACGHGLNLTAAGTVVFAELYWVPGQMIQAEDRSHRIGTEFSSIQIHYLIAEGTIDETVFRILQRKWRLMTSTLDGEQQQLALETRSAFASSAATSLAASEMGASASALEASLSFESYLERLVREDEINPHGGGDQQRDLSEFFERRARDSHDAGGSAAAATSKERKRPLSRLAAGGNAAAKYAGPRGAPAAEDTDEASDFELVIEDDEEEFAQTANGDSAKKHRI
ncbi:SWI2/SNF2-containing protein [Besnoitia besnoiti]|uniref:SWI2/SNF2-containing protein n=1 Tax=Besnoitia besnoiti TaxID=94643 RepID=A0A2A9M5Y5_BESBE|nr:SWI2/SNF2-containing protein [Besnoitia besnoiti]PFH31296.1 SWI2/SNF2-containing protein [Besnoitia besnoiti]